MKKKYKFLLLFISTLTLQYAYSQRVAYFKDFDYFKMEGVDTLANTNNLPNFYVKCIYDNNNIVTKICPASRLTWEAYQTSYCIPIVQHMGQKFLFLGAGKNRQGYTRGLFQKKIFESDSALILHDTLIFKLASPKYYIIQLYIKLANDSVYFREATYLLNKLTKPKLNSLKSFEFYKNWFVLDDWADKIVGGEIRLMANPILEFKIFKSHGTVTKINITKERLIDMPTMPISLFWLKSRGLLN